MIYLAGPMFNEVQIEHAEKLAKHCRNNGFEVFAPVEGLFLQDQGALTAQKIFDRNVEAMQKCDSMFAQLDYPLPRGFSTVVRSHGNAVKITLPDSGTAFEIGYANRMGIPVIGYYVEKPLKMNLMLTCSLRGIVDDIFKFMNNDQINWSLMKDWRGELI